ncbi:MAG: glycosyltransferase [Bacteroidales bacterium]|nr:glycosyltransferase [Bacteroidales bacterium]
MTGTQTPKKVLIITYYWPPAGGPGVQRWLKFARYLPDFNVEPFILTVDEKKASYAFYDPSLEDEVRKDLTVFRTSTREFYTFYLKFTGRRQIPFSGFVQESGISFKEKVIRFLRTHLFIPDPRLGWNRFAYKKAREVLRQENITQIITTGPPHSSHLIGLKLKKKLPHVNWIADFRDPWTHIFFFDQLNHSPYSRLRHKKLEHRVIDKSDKVIVVGHSMKSGFLKDYPELVPDKIVIIPNGFDDNDFIPGDSITESDFVITYTGTLAANYPLEALTNAIKTINKEHKGVVKLRIIGEINFDIQEEVIQQIGQESVEFVPRLAHAKAIEYLFRSSMQLIIIPEAIGNESILTGKIFEYLASGKPILGIGPEDGDASQVLKETGAGKMFEYSKKEEIESYILKVYNELRDHNIFYNREIIEKYSRKKITGDLVSLFP